LCSIFVSFQGATQNTQLVLKSKWQWKRGTKTQAELEHLLPVSPKA
jgi:hypothetical protein